MLSYPAAEPALREDGNSPVCRKIVHRGYLLPSCCEKACLLVMVQLTSVRQWVRSPLITVVSTLFHFPVHTGMHV